MTCPICESSRLRAFLRREQVPVHQNLIMSDETLAVRVPRGELQLEACIDCGFVFNSAFEPSKLSYGANYDNSQVASPFFQAYVEDLAHALIFEHGVRNCRIVEVGCGNGFFLRRLVQPKGIGNIGHGFDPSYVGPEVDLNGRVRFERCLFDLDCADLPADVVVCRHVIEHVPDPLNLLAAIRETLSRSPRPRLFVEAPCTEWILQHVAFWDVFYEHCSYFTARSLAGCLELAGFQVQNVRHVFGGQYLSAEASLAPGDSTPVSLQTGNLASLFEQFGASERELIEMWRTKLHQLGRTGRVALWGAGAKGSTLANLVDPARELIVCVVDLNPRKQGRFVPGTGHPIVGYTQLPKHQVRSAIVINPNYLEEILAMVRTAHLTVDLVDAVGWQAATCTSP